METLEYSEIIDAITLIGGSFYRNCIPIILNFSLWLTGIVIFYFSLKKIRDNNIDYACLKNNSRVKSYQSCAEFNDKYMAKTEKSFELLKKSEWIYLFVLLISTAFLLIIEAFINEIPTDAIPQKSISLYNVVYLLLSIIIPQVSRINTYVQFNLT